MREEPAWKAELRENLDEEFISSGAEIFDLVVPYIQTAEQRGRREALWDALHAIDNERLLDETGTSEDVAYTQAIDDAHRSIQVLIDPDTP